MCAAPGALTGRACLTRRTAAGTDAIGESLALRAEIGFINTHLQEVVSAPVFISAEFLLGSVIVGGGWFFISRKERKKKKERKCVFSRL